MIRVLLDQPAGDSSEEERSAGGAVALEIISRFANVAGNGTQKHSHASQTLHARVFSRYLIKIIPPDKSLKVSFRTLCYSDGTCKSTRSSAPSHFILPQIGIAFSQSIKEAGTTTA